jgi:hypothetical protein
VSDTTEDIFLAAARGLADRVVRVDAASAIFPGGRNGPYLDLESPVRNSAHVLSAVSIAYGVTGEAVYAEKGRALATFLLSEHEFTVASVAVQRQRHPKDWCNGVIGPAWVIEGLALAGRLLEMPEAAERARHLAAEQTFDERAALWRRHDPREGVGTIDRTLNHRAYFASAAALAAEKGTIIPAAVGAFLDHLVAGGFRVTEAGRIIHHVSRKDEAVGSVRGLRERVLRSAADQQIVRRLRASRSASIPSSQARDLGYHIFSLFSLAGLRMCAPTHPFWRSEPLRRALAFAVAPGWLESLDENPYAYPYNGPGLELPFVARAFDDLEPKLRPLADSASVRQVELTWDGTMEQFCRRTDDRLTLSARSYELGLSLAAAFAAPAQHAEL